MTPSRTCATFLVKKDKYSDGRKALPQITSIFEHALLLNISKQAFCDCGL